MDYKEMISKASEYYDFTIFVYKLTKSTIIGPDVDIPYIISAEDMWPMIGRFNGSSITIYPFTVLKDCPGNDTQLKSLLAMAIIHELHHVTQNIDHHRYETDPKYKKMIEDSCDWMTWDYINRFKDILEEFLEISIDFEYLIGDFNPIVHTNYLRYKKIDANLWVNIVNSLVARTSDGEGLFPGMQEILEKSNTCMLSFEERKTENVTDILFMKYKGEYILPDYEVYKTIANVSVVPTGSVQCAYGTLPSGVDVFTIIYTMSRGEDSNLYSPLIRFKEEQ